MRVSLWQGFFDNTVRVDNLRPYSVAIKYLTGPKVRLEDPVVVAANETCVEMAKDFKVCAPGGLSFLDGRRARVRACVWGGRFCEAAAVLCVCVRCSRAWRSGYMWRCPWPPWCKERTRWLPHGTLPPLATMHSTCH